MAKIPSAMCDARKYPCSPHGRSLEIPGGMGVVKAKCLEEKYEAKLEFPGWGGGGGEEVQKKIPSIGGVWIFSGTTQYYQHVLVQHCCNSKTFSDSTVSIRTTLPLQNRHNFFNL